MTETKDCIEVKVPVKVVIPPANEISLYFLAFVGTTDTNFRNAFSIRTFKEDDIQVFSKTRSALLCLVDEAAHKYIKKVLKRRGPLRNPEDGHIKLKDNSSQGFEILVPDYNSFLRWIRGFYKTHLPLRPLAPFINDIQARLDHSSQLAVPSTHLPILRKRLAKFAWRRVDVPLKDQRSPTMHRDPVAILTAVQEWRSKKEHISLKDACALLESVANRSRMVLFVKSSSSTFFNMVDYLNNIMENPRKETMAIVRDYGLDDDKVKNLVARMEESIARGGRWTDTFGEYF
ncbi:hypothetical protein GGR57DRAFT_506465 [Xylariaceae sp. FL1272]|nr:hypothetical protein GGR57DRAFT_506465 [Xylariaceae sp. FL1272]